MSLEISIIKKLKSFDININFSCADRELLAIVGPSGSGKTTIIRTICGLEKPDSGIIIHNNIIWSSPKDKINVPTRKRKIGYVFQEYTLFPNLNVYKNVSFAGRKPEKIKELMKRLDIWHLKDSKPYKISGGERQRCAICQTLARDPEVLLMDEPFSALDVLTRKSLRGMMKELKKDLHIPILYVTHDIREARELSDNILPVVNGKAEHKWMMQFILAEEDESLCKKNNFLYEERNREIQLPSSSGKYIL